MAGIPTLPALSGIELQTQECDELYREMRAKLAKDHSERQSQRSIHQLSEHYEVVWMEAKLAVKDAILDTMRNKVHLLLSEVLGDNTADPPAEPSAAAEVPGSRKTPSSDDYEPVALAEFKDKLLHALGSRYAITKTLWYDVGQDDRIFIYFDHTSRTSFTLMFSPFVFQHLGADDPGCEYDSEGDSEAYADFYDNDSEYWRLYDKDGRVFVSLESHPESAL